MMTHHSGRSKALRTWVFTSKGPHTYRSLAAEAAMWGLLTQKDLSMDTITQMEAQAVFEARRAFAEALVNCGYVVVPEAAGNRNPIAVIDIFAKLDGKQIDSIIMAAYYGVQASMMRQSAKGEIPFPLDASPEDDKAKAKLVNGEDDVPSGYFRNAAGHLLEIPKEGKMPNDKIPF